MGSVIIVGGGPAGLSAALYTVRAGHDTLVIARDGGALEKAHVVENYYGIAAPVSGAELNARTRENALRLGVRFLDAEVTAVTMEADGRYRVTAGDDTLLADGVILATGAERAAPKIPGAAEFFGRGVSSCAVCDAFAARRRRVAVIGAGDLALHEVGALTDVAEEITLCTNGEEPPTTKGRLRTVKTPVAAIEGDTLVRRVRFADGSALPVEMVFLATGVAGAGRLAAALGLAVEDGRIAVDKNMATALPRLYAAGDCTGGLMQIATAAGEGAVAGVSLSAELKKQ